MSKKNELVPISAKELQIVEYHGQRVVTTEQLAVGYGVDVKNIQNNFARNESRFSEGKHFFNVEGEELQQLKNLPSLRGLVNKRTPRLKLWTERGAANHSKMLETDQAWNYFDDLTEFYFTRRDAITTEAELLSNPAKLRSMLSVYAENVERLEGENKTLSTTVDSLEKHFTKGMTIPAFCKSLNGVNTAKIMGWAMERNWLYNERKDPEKKPRWRVASYARDRYLTEEENKVKPHGQDEFVTRTAVLLERGCHRLYALYMKGELPMKKTWNGEYHHDKAIYTPEVKS
ncbi:ORF6N domain-containing protein [Xenorhabdus bovienii]|uniref:Phage antirepressor protein n=2 Tax=Xenorhabdus bovienii TaxID=40576 RepID=A0A077PM65_XENBV|nr:ORF6N domain-containing protein [Xenorhabdus bovienii]MDE1489082.1 ORF6N domain-containing protein [Xenorhabdus bovienii]MDE9479979.1 ORF6N domain-containing protein [Xenorhabdus bovienii]MDE9532907.1 ORF6N domain-containing protein [Xenorhabdus bovienii]CDH22148.1 Phage antirepressor protein [Xenorhabdus bovienii str. kraussei Quebec]